MHVNKVSHVRTIDLVAKEVGEDVCFLCDVASEMEPEDGLIWVQGLGEEGVMELAHIQFEGVLSQDMFGQLSMALTAIDRAYAKAKASRTVDVSVTLQD